MKLLTIKVTMLVFVIGLLSGFFNKLSLMENLVRSSEIYILFSVLILLVLLIQHQSTSNMVGAESKKKQQK